MTVELVTNTNRYQGLSSDEKPTTGVKRGSTFFEEDTGFEYRYTGSSWVAQTAEVRLVSADGDVLYDKNVCASNQTTTLLGADESWTGEWVDTTNYVMAIIDVNTDQDSAENGLEIQLSNDGINIIHYHSFTILANDPDGHHYPSELELNYYRLKYTNGSTPQTIFKLFTTLFSRSVEEGHAHGLDYPLKVDHPAPIVRAVQTGFTSGGESVNAGYTTAGNPKSSIEEYDDAVSPFRKDIEGLGIQTVGTTAVALVFTGTPTRAIKITALEDNSGYIYVGKSNVTSVGANSIDYLRPGEYIVISYDDVSNPIYVVGSAAGQQYIAGAIL